jgi:enoyl-CoA hydratase/carnithine racemase
MGARQAGALMIAAHTPSALLDLIADGLDDTALDSVSSWPAVLVDLTPAFSSTDLLRATQLLQTAPVVLIGVSENAVADDPAVVGLDILLCSSDIAPAPWVACGSLLNESVVALLDSITGSPDASIGLTHLLRVSERSSAAEAVVAESWVYSLLQGGERYSAWLAGRSSRMPKPRPEHSVVAVQRFGDELRITLDRPEVHNAYGARMRDELVEAFRLVDVDQTITRVVLRGNGPSFCSGGDLDEFGTAPAPVEAHSIRTRRNAGVALSAIAERVEVHVHGTCVGAGVELPAFASRVVAHPDTTFLLPEISMGLVPGAGGTSSIPRRIGRHRAAYFGLCGRPIDVTTALAWGLIDAVDAQVLEQGKDTNG